MRIALRIVTGSLAGALLPVWIGAMQLYAQLNGEANDWPPYWWLNAMAVLSSVSAIVFVFSWAIPELTQEQKAERTVWKREREEERANDKAEKARAQASAEQGDRLVAELKAHMKRERAAATAEREKPKSLLSGYPKVTTLEDAVAAEQIGQVTQEGVQHAERRIREARAAAAAAAAKEASTTGDESQDRSWASTVKLGESFKKVAESMNLNVATRAEAVALGQMASKIGQAAPLPAERMKAAVEAERVAMKVLMTHRTKAQEIYDEYEDRKNFDDHLQPSAVGHVQVRLQFEAEERRLHRAVEDARLRIVELKQKARHDDAKGRRAQPPGTTLDHLTPEQSRALKTSVPEPPEDQEESPEWAPKARKPWPGTDETDQRSPVEATLQAAAEEQAKSRRLGKSAIEHLLNSDVGTTKLPEEPKDEKP